MRIEELIKKIPLDIKTCKKGVNNNVAGGYVSDLLSDVIGNSKEGDIWITLQTHVNIVAVASLKRLAGIIIIGNRDPHPETLQKAENENVTIITTSLSAFEVAGKIYELIKK